MSEFICGPNGRNTSGAYNQNFLWKHDNIYIMDNHRAALWCWLQEMSDDQKYSMFHIDMHYDLDPGISKRWPPGTPNLSSLDFPSYLDVKHPKDARVPLIVWDNYLSIFEELYENQIDYFFAATQEVGTPPAQDSRIEEIKLGQLSQSIRMHLLDNGLSAAGWIVNLDLDFFFAHQPSGLKVFLADSYIDEVFGAIAEALTGNRIACLTVALSPECCGGWANSEALCARLTSTLGIDFKLPD